MAMLYELRIYHIPEGKINDIHRRFSEVTLTLFEKHGVKVYDFWEHADGQGPLYYVLEYQDRESRERNWQAFISDPEWIRAKAVSEVNGPIVERVESIDMKRVSYWPRSTNQ